ncbi:hypothetical protein UFOVP1024_32 [uncultured Caudovirales phage]|uniref:Uncharacterized protein n=1 Tax=uncultured Caudovirales phage TaxID=2100421 RepID=A0A6J5Q487_9CAUD|nr:hypothetical protein UFOVP949_11 [uncultured Caudovirales phage]CAB4179049.1 hypothetical protein UFOVP1024_32 [uncultured Caudovirales phage]
MNIIAMAEEAGLAFNFDGYPDIWATYTNIWRKEIECFVALVEAAARADEREECAKVCEEDGLLWGQRYAAAIRARGTT